MKKNLIILVIVILFITACSTSNTPPTQDIGAIQTSALNTAWAAANLTSTANAPTNTPLPTNTPIPTVTSTPVPAPLIFNGQGDYVLDFNKWNDDPAVLHLKNIGSGNFAVWNYGKDGIKIDLLANTIGNYEGFLPLDFLKNEDTTRLEIKSDGQWTVEILPFAPQYLHMFDIPGIYNGNGDDVIFIKEPDIAKFDCQFKGNFAVWSYGGTSRDLVVNEIAPYSGTVVLRKDTVILIVKAPGAWSVDISK